MGVVISTTPIRPSPRFPAPLSRRISRAGIRSFISAAAISIRSVTSSTAYRSIARFDNYPGSTAGSLGQQELQVYAGGGTAGESASGLAGFINQVIKTGTFPGYATVSGGIGSTTYLSQSCK